MGSANQVVLLIDGAVGLENMGRLCFKDAIQIVDFFHAMEHGAQVLEALIGKEHPQYKRRLRRWAKRLLRNGVSGLIKDAQPQSRGRAEEAAVNSALGYFINNVERMQYGTFRKQGYFIGSGVVEAGCKTVIGARCKQSGMRWSEQGAENILALRGVHRSQIINRALAAHLNPEELSESSARFLSILSEAA